MSIFFQKGLILAVATLFADQLQKWYMLEVVKIGREPIEVLPFFNFVMVWNKGISFGMFQDHDYSHIIFTIIALVIVGILLIWLRNVTNTLAALAIGLVVGGALGNVIDRIRFGAVADFFDVHVAGYHWPAFNIADAAVFIGAVLLCIDGFINDDKNDTDTKNA
jgi:signal peptidase II